jgi:hypothetical protein
MVDRACRLLVTVGRPALYLCLVEYNLEVTIIHLAPYGGSTESKQSA